MRDIGDIVAAHPFFQGLAPELCRFIAGCGRNARFGAGEYLFHMGGRADVFYLLRHGRVSLELAVPGREPSVIQSLHEGDIVGASWLVPPYRWGFDARATEVCSAIAMDASCLRDKCEGDHHLGYELMKRFVPVVVGRMQAARLQMLDVYAPHPAEAPAAR